MTELESVEVQSLEEFTKEVHRIAAADDGPRWYRGCHSTAHRLIPRLYRHPKVSALDDLHAMERELLGWFTIRSPPFLTKDVPDAWDRFFMMQHYRIPTRLLDWTESPFTALYFALRESKKGPPAGDAAVWTLAPGAWNMRVFRRTSLPKIILSPGAADPDGILEGYNPKAKINSVLPAAINGTHSNQRIVAQRGTFVIFGLDPRPMDEIFSVEPFTKGTLGRITIPGPKRAEILRSLFSIGVTDSLIFPDLEGLARETCQMFGLEEI